MDKAYENRHGIKFKLVERYLIRRITGDGLVKCFESWGDAIGKYSFKTKEEAMELIGTHDLYDAVILTIVEQDFDHE